MSKREIIKKCPECGNDFEAARLNQKFCDPDCKMHYNNRNTMAKYHERNQEDLITREVNKVLYRNWQILLKYVNQELALSVLEAEGFKEDFITSFIKGKEKMIFICYDVKYMFPTDSTIKIAKL